MLTNDQIETLKQPKRVMLIIFGALVAGVLFFALIAAISHISNGKPLFHMEFGFMAIIGVVFAAMVLVPSFVVPIFIRRSAAKELSDEFSGQFESPGAAIKAMVGLQTGMIIGLALLEGAAFFNLVGYMTDGNVWNLLLACGLVMVMLVRIPLPGRVEDWVSDMLDDAKLER